MGEGIVRAAWAGTAVFAATAVPAAIAPGAMGEAAAVVAMALFLAGCGLFLGAYVVAVGRSRADELSIPGIWFLSGSAPPAVRRRLLGAVAVEAVVGVATAGARPFTSLAFGVLVPIWGLGLTGLWGARHGRFVPRTPSSPRRARPRHGA